MDGNSPKVKPDKSGECDNLSITSADSLKTEDWELLKFPTLLRSPPNEMSTSPEHSNLGSETKSSKRLCGYLMKFGDKALIKTWKRRWFVYEPRRCILYYYHRPQDNEPLGNIDISNATFNVSADDKFGFEISCVDRTYQLQAPDRNTMLFWLQELQARRREHQNPRKSLDTFGLLGEVEHSEPHLENIYSNDQEIIEQPDTIGEHTGITGKKNWNFLFSNLNAEFKNWKKNTFNPITGERLESFQVFPECNSDSSKETTINDSALADETFTSNMINDGAAKYNPNSCRTCEENHATIYVLKEAISVAQIEMETRDEVIKSLSEQLRYAATNNSREKSNKQKSSEEQDQYISQLTRMVEKFKSEIEELKNKLENKNVLVEELKNKETILKEMIHAKNDTLSTLTCKNEVAGNAEELRVDVSIAETEKLDYQQLKDTCNALRAQNSFLNNEILELNKLHNANSEKLKISIEKLSRQEAEFLKLKSRYLFLLQEFSTPRRAGSSDDVSPDILERLIDEAINEKEDLQEKCKHLKEKIPDRYGFYDVFDEGELSSIDIIDDDGDIPLEISVKVKWENYLVSQGNMTFTKTEELKSLVRQGIPHQYRAQVWKDLLFLRINNERNLLEPGYYAKLLKNKEGTYSPSAKQIELDLLRTLPNNKYYENINSEGTSKLRRVLLAYSWHNPTVGYCQGLNRLGAIILLYLDEETAFWALVAIVECLMPADYFSRSLLGAQIDQRVLRDLLEEKFPRLGAHLHAMNFDLSLISFNWFLTVFVDLLPIELMLRVWDTFFFEGSKVLFRYALAIFKLFEDDMLKYMEPGPIFDFFRKLPKSRFDTQKVFHIAFVQLNPFSRRHIESKRRFYRPILQSQLDEFEVMRKVYREKRENNMEELLSDDDN